MLIAIILIILVLSYAVIPTIYFKLKYKLLRKKKGHKIYLTFDDGPSEFTEKVLDVLAKNKVKASFFCVAFFALDNPNIIKRMQKEGHLIGLHSYKHENGIVMLPNKVNDDFDKSLKAMKNLNQEVIYYRPPWGHLNLWILKNIKKHNLKLMLWNVMAEDWLGNTTSDCIINKLLKRTKGGDIICLHDGRGKNSAPLRTIKALEQVLPILKEKGFIFETVDNYEK